ncbi:hypothetical protein [Aneurinibacillus aneurinilyticus]|nr:hypothetical protein [Aneurinibacillus aneurinilyticus]
MSAIIDVKIRVDAQATAEDNILYPPFHKIDTADVMEKDSPILH